MKELSLNEIQNVAGGFADLAAMEVFANLGPAIAKTAALGVLAIGVTAAVGYYGYQYFCAEEANTSK